MLFNDAIEYYQAIANELVEIIPEPWNRVTVTAKLFESSIETQVIYYKPDGSKESRVRTVMINRYFYELAQVVSNEDKGLYKQCNFALHDNGKFDVNFEY
ncbi:immunity protein YezG family protein [Pseudomonas sp. WAC2]|uniref:immunity protein YezG family protein n=1 Tax=Pseudomonas sp. WAC2 TaxID=3055057 RepID=UPI0025B2317B|nr:immunity protein YezG family protein [Pseudomonas sp. WAC2]MDN3238032.1 DUF600 family protein [Pseudomonas sp. WAC2]